MEDKILNYIMQMAEEVDCSSVDRIEILFVEDGMDIDIESNDMGEIGIKEMLGWNDEEVELKSMIIALLMTSFKETSKKHLSELYEVLDYGPKWVDALNMYFDDVAEQNKKSYKLQVMPT